MPLPPHITMSKPAGPAERGTRLRPATLRDYDQIALLESSHGLEAKSREDWSRLWVSNPAYRDDWPIGWVVEDRRGTIVASVGNIPLSCEFEGRPLLAASGRAQVADRAYRASATLLLSYLIHQPGIDLYLNNTMTESAAVSFRVFECPRVPAGSWDESAFWILDHRAFAEALLKHRGSTALLRSLARPAASAMALRDRVRQRRMRSDPAVVGCDDFDQRFEDFWQRLRRRHRATLLAVRSLSALRWHYGPALARKQVWIAAIAGAGGLGAYAVFDRKDNSALGLKRVRLVDFVSLDGTTALLGPLVRWALDRCRVCGVHMLESVGRWLQAGEFMAVFAPHRRKLGTWTYFYRASRPELAEKLKDRRIWAPSLFDGNASL